jgi:hypothetical protein
MRADKSVRRSSVVIAVTLQRLLEDPMRSWGQGELLVLDALRRSKASVSNATPTKLAEYVGGLEPDQVAGVLSNVKGIYHELLFVHAENFDGDEVSARVFAETNYPGADVEFIVDGEIIREVELKAASSMSALSEHLRRYPDIDILTTAKIAGNTPEVGSSGISNETLTRDVMDTVDDLQGETVLEETVDGLATSALMSAAMVAGKVVRRRQLSPDELKTILSDVVVGGAAAIFLDALIDGVA